MCVGSMHAWGYINGKGRSESGVACTCKKLQASIKAWRC
jgi:hypothetical protein